jgi:pSer/pThr/pTyr-binding forkhead associated (FHA) protein
MGRVAANRPAGAQSVSELKARTEAERAGRPFLLYRDGADQQRLFSLESDQVSVGRRASSDLALDWDDQVSRLHAQFERVEEDWTVVDDGLSRNGTFVNGSRIGGRVRLRNGDVIRAGATAIAYRRPSDELSSPTNIGTSRLSADDLPTTQRRVLVALARPYKHDDRAAPASNGQIAEELHLSVDAVKAHLRALYQRFGLEALPQSQKRARLVAEALQSGVVSRREL